MGDSGWVTCSFLVMMQSTELVSGSQSFLENPADYPKYLVVHVERASKGGVGCHQRCSHTMGKCDPVFLELLRNE